MIDPLDQRGMIHAQSDEDAFGEGAYSCYALRRSRDPEGIRAGRALEVTLSAPEQRGCLSSGSGLAILVTWPDRSSELDRGHEPGPVSKRVLRI